MAKFHVSRNVLNHKKDTTFSCRNADEHEKFCFYVGSPTTATTMKLHQILFFALEFLKCIAVNKTDWFSICLEATRKTMQTIERENVKLDLFE